MTTPAVTVTAPSATTRAGFIATLKAKASGAFYGTRSWLGEAARKTGLDRAASFTRRYLSKVIGWGSAVVRAAGALPLSVLAVTSRTGQKMIKATFGFAFRVTRWISSKVFGAIDWTLRRFGGWGNRMADKFASARMSAANFVVRNAVSAWNVVAPYVSPERLYMRIAKVGGYMATTAGLISTFVPGAWVIPAYLFAGIAGLMLSPTVRNSSIFKRFIGDTEDVAVEEGKRVVHDAMEQMIAEFGPDMAAWSAAARADYAIKKSILKALNNDKDPFKGLSNNQKKRAQQWLRDFEASVHEIVEKSKAATGEAPLLVSESSGLVVVGAADGAEGKDS